MSDKEHPHKQPFNVTPKFNRNKKRAWWQLGNSNNRKREKKQDD